MPAARGQAPTYICRFLQASRPTQGRNQFSAGRSIEGERGGEGEGDRNRDRSLERFTRRGRGGSDGGDNIWRGGRRDDGGREDGGEGGR